MVSVKTFKFLSECISDIFIVLDEICNQYNVINISYNFNECEFSIKGNVELIDLIKIASKCNDCHYIEETINYIENYKPERIYRDRLDDFN